jgi:hypothetical protein
MSGQQNLKTFQRAGNVPAKTDQLEYCVELKPFSLPVHPHRCRNHSNGSRLLIENCSQIWIEVREQFLKDVVMSQMIAPEEVLI